MTIPVERQALCQGGCGTTIDTDTCCSFDNGNKADILCCATCCPNCYGGAGNGPSTAEEANK